MQRNCLYLSVIGQIWTIVMCKSYFSVLAPGTIKSNRNYTASVTLHAADGPVIIRLGILRSPVFYKYQDVSLQPFQTKTIDFELPKLNRNHKYELVAEGVQGLRFKNFTKLLVDDVMSALKIYMQTSKGIYKPGDLVQFRVIILDVHLKPVKLDEPVRVQILDAKDHRVKQFKNIPLLNGIFSGNIQLSEQTNFGIWKILVSISGKYNMRELKTFKVDKYVLPKFSIHLDTVDDFVHEDQILSVAVYGKYTHGKCVEGIVIVNVIIGRHTYDTQTKDIQDCKAKFKLYVGNYIESAELYPNFDVEAILIDKYTNVSLSTKKKIRNHNQRYKIVVPIEEIEFRENRPYLIKAKVRYLNDTEVHDRTTPIFMKHGSKVYQSFLDDHGVTSFIFDYEKDKNNVFQFQNTSLYLSNVFYHGQQSDDAFCKLSIKPGIIQMEQILEVVVSSASYIPYLVYVLMGHSNIIYTKYVAMEAGQNFYTIKIKPTIEMVPNTQLYVHYIDRGQLKYCDISINLPNEFENKISVSILNTAVEPGQEVTLNIQAQPQSRVGLLAIDLSAHLLNSNYSLNKDAIVTELLYDQSYAHFCSTCFGEQSGLVILTNADIINDESNFFLSLLGNSRVTRKLRKSKLFENAEPLLRTKFPETWIFEEIDILNANTSFSLKVPDTITTWLVTAISIHEQSGFGITDQSLNITVFRPFFISTNLPYSIRRGETIAIPLTIFNYYEQNLSCQIIMNNTDGEFQFMDKEIDTLNLTQAVKQVNIAANSGTSVTFTVQALKLGQLKLQFIASSPLARDAIELKLKVEPEGILIKQNQEIYITLNQSDASQSSVLTAHIPRDIVRESEFLKLSLGGDTLGSPMENLNNLILLPTGCGEQNMIKFAPNILVLDYLKAINKWHDNEKLVAKALKFIEIGYQNELTYRHNTGGYSVFGLDGEESTWLTAYVIRFFIKAVKYVAVEPEIITSGLDFLASQQQANGEFLHTGHLFYPAHQNRYGFTAFVLMSFMENRKYRNKYDEVIQKGLEFLSTNINNTNDAYALSIMATTFQIVESDEASLIRNKLLTMSKEKDNRKWWSSSDERQTNDVEITSYVLMALLQTDETGYFSAFRWLIEQRNENGGFRTTHETVVGLQALIKFCEKELNLYDTLLNVSYTAKDEQGLEVKRDVFEVSSDNFMILQQHELPRTTRSIEYRAQGRGNSLLQFSYQYYETEEEAKAELNTNIRNLTFQNTLESVHNFRFPKNFDIMKSRTQSRSLMKKVTFVIKPLAKMSSEKEMLMEVCFKYQPSSDLEFQKTNMIIMDILLPSGFVANSNSVQELLDEELITKTELKNSDSRIILYFDQLQAKDEHCLNILADKIHDVLVQKLKSSTIEMYDFYNKNLHDIVFYTITM